ncbi:putative cuticle collagen, partial [Trichinella pseudospiralis]
MEADSRIKAYKFVAYSAAIFSVVSVLAACISIPMAYNYIHHVKRQMYRELNYCRGSAEDILSEVHYLKKVPTKERNKRSYNIPNGSVINEPIEELDESECDHCCQPGPPGNVGLPGRPGKPGRP